MEPLVSIAMYREKACYPKIETALLENLPNWTTILEVSQENQSSLHWIFWRCSETALQAKYYIFRSFVSIYVLVYTSKLYVWTCSKQGKVLIIESNNFLHLHFLQIWLLNSIPHFSFGGIHLIFNFSRTGFIIQSTNRLTLDDVEHGSTKSKFFLPVTIKT